jgi:hypothetical protein
MEDEMSDETNPLDALEALEREATPRPWVGDPHSSTHVVGLNGRHVCSTGGYSTNTDRGEHLVENDRNARAAATGRNILPEVIELAEAALATVERLFRVSASEDTDYVGDDGRALESALDALLRAISVEVKR